MTPTFILKKNKPLMDNNHFSPDGGIQMIILGWVLFISNMFLNWLGHEFHVPNTPILALDAAQTDLILSNFHRVLTIFLAFAQAYVTYLGYKKITAKKNADNNIK